jgi:hypothetical protein
MVIEHGAGFQASEKDRLLNRLIATWAKASRVPLKTLKADVQNWIKFNSNLPEITNLTNR